MKYGSEHLGKITGQHSRPQFHLSLLGSIASHGRGDTWRQKWERLTITGGQGSHNKTIGYGASRAYAPGPDKKEEECVAGGLGQILSALTFSLRLNYVTTQSIRAML
jgi:hypothetical protein